MEYVQGVVNENWIDMYKRKIATTVDKPQRKCKFYMHLSTITRKSMRWHKVVLNVCFLLE